MTRYPAGQVMFAAPDDEAAPDEAREYCRTMGLTMNDAVIKQSNGQVLVVLKRDWPIEAGKEE